MSIQNEEQLDQNNTSNGPKKTGVQLGEYFSVQFFYKEVDQLSILSAAFYADNMDAAEHRAKCLAVSFGAKQVSITSIVTTPPSDHSFLMMQRALVADSSKHFITTEDEVDRSL